MASMIKPIVIAILVGALLLGGAYLVLANLKPSAPADAAHMAEGTNAEDSGDFMKSFIVFFRDSCVTSAKASLTKNGVDPSSEANAAKVDSYCSCAIDGVQAQLNVQELLALKLNPSSEPAASKMKGIVQACVEKVGKIGP
jgi:hypothetical protein